MLRCLSLLLPALLVTLSPLWAQPRPTGETYYRRYRLDAFDRFIFSDTLKAPEDDVEAVGVARDTLGRVTSITRYWYGNVDTKAPWAIMEIVHAGSDSGALRAETRSYQLVNGRPTTIGKIASFVLRYRADGSLISRTNFDLQRKPVDDGRYIGGTMMRQIDSTTYMQEWHVSTGKQQRGWGSDLEFAPFGPLPFEAWFRRITVNPQGWLLREEVMGIEKVLVPYPGGELGRRYEYDDAGRVLRIRLVDRNDEAMGDTAGVAAIEYEYDNAGRVSLWRTLDENGNLHARKPDSTAETRYSYHPFTGHITRVVRLNNKGETISDGPR